MFSGRRMWSALMVCVLGVVMLGAGTPDNSARFGRVGGNLMCVCSCGQMLLQCNHVGCPDSGPMIDELHEQLAGPNGAGADSLVLNWFVAKYGASVLAAPIRGGFDMVAWIVPLLIFALAVFGTGWMVRVWAGRRGLQTAGAGAAALEPRPAGEDEMRARIRRETEYR